MPQFCKYCWLLLPIRKVAVGQEVVDDCVTLAVQFWPTEKMSQADAESTEESQVLLGLMCDITRCLAFIYGKERFDAIWKVGLRTVLPNLLGIMVRWWRVKKANRAKIHNWRRKWVVPSLEK